MNILRFSPLDILRFRRPAEDGDDDDGGDDEDEEDDDDDDDDDDPTSFYFPAFFQNKFQNMFSKVLK